jgi:pimeloyl-ACP methyl ester carboxylesterase
MKEETFEWNGHLATVIIPDNPNGKWIWKTEFFHAFEQAELRLLELGYVRVYYQISDKFGSPEAVRLMRRFHKELLTRYSFLEEKTILFGFSRGGLYAYNYALFYPESVEKMYLDAPVLNLRSWPWHKGINHDLFCKEYNVNEETFPSFRGSPVDTMKEFAEYNIPLLIVAGNKDESVPFEENSAIFAEYYQAIGKKLLLIVKEGAGHHPHSLDDVTPIIAFVESKVG